MNFKFRYNLLVCKLNKFFVSKSKYIIKKYLSKEYVVNYAKSKIKFIFIDIKEICI